ncbi:MAG: serine hydrolase domain-containing protein [Ardenticatenaceae bacterium]
MQLTNPEGVGLSSARLNKLKALAQRYVDQKKLPCVLTMVARRGQVVHFEPYGLMDMAAEKPVQKDTIFRIYSMTKPITSIGIMMLYEEGHFLLSDPVSKFIPAFKELKVVVGQDYERMDVLVGSLEREITLHDLLTHTSGLSYGLFEGHPVDDMYRDKNILGKDQTLAEMIEKIVSLPLVGQPGKVWQYSVATDVLGRVIQVVSGKSFDRFIEERILQPLGMSDTAFYVSQEKQKRFASLYALRPETGQLAQIPSLLSNYSPSVRFFSGGGGLVSTATDYMRFCQMLLNGGELDGVRLVGRKTIELMTINHLPPELVPIALGETVLNGYGFGLGFRVMTNLAQGQVIGSEGEYGWGGAASTFFFIDPQEELIGILMTQFMPSSYYPIRDQFKTAVYQALID